MISRRIEIGLGIAALAIAACGRPAEKPAEYVTVTVDEATGRGSAQVRKISPDGQLMLEPKIEQIEFQAIPSRELDLASSDQPLALREFAEAHRQACVTEAYLITATPPRTTVGFRAFASPASSEGCARFQALHR